MHEREYKRLRATIEADYKRKLEALELIYGMANKNGVGAGTSTTRVKGDLAKAVIQAVQATTGDFNVRNIEEALKVTHPALAASLKRASISNTLKRLEGHEVEVVTKGSGKRANTYRKRPR